MLEGEHQYLVFNEFLLPVNNREEAVRVSHGYITRLEPPVGRNRACSRFLVIVVPLPPGSSASQSLSN